MGGMSEDIAKMLLRVIYEGRGELKAARKDMNDTEKSMDSAGKTAEKTGKQFDAAFDTGKLAAFGVAIKKVSSQIMDYAKQSADYIETLNLLEVAFDGNTESVRKFASRYADVLNLDDSTILKSAAHFKVLTQSMGIATETGEKLSELLTKMTLDVSSLYNIDFDKAQTALQYAMEGRGTSLKQRTGVSVLETSVQTTLDAIGVDAYVEDMNDAEKAIARVISMEYQLMSSQGDLARTIEAPANQMRIMREQLSLLARNIGNVFLPIIAKVLPYLNAMLIVLNAIISVIARLVGYKGDMFNTFEEPNTAAEYFGGVGDAIDGVGRSAEKTAQKLQGLRGFDKLNVIKSPNDTGGAGGGGGGGGVGGINPALLDAFDSLSSKYKDKLDGIKTRASEIAENILRWLGFEKRINKETGEIEWYFKKLTGGTILGALGTGGVIYVGINKILGFLKRIGLIKFGSLKELFKTLKDGKIVSVVTKLKAGFEGLATALGLSTGALALIVAAIVAVGAALIYAYNHNEKFRKSVNDMFESLKDLFGTIIDAIQPALQGLKDLIIPVWNYIKDNIVLIVQVIYDTIVLVFKNIVDTISGVAKIITDIINGDFDKAFEDLKNLIVTLWNNWHEYLGKIRKRFEEWAKKIIEHIKDFVPKAIAKMGELLEWIKQLPDKFFYWAGEAVGKMWKVISETNWLQLGLDVITALIKGIKDIGKKLDDIGEKIWKKVDKAIKNTDWGKLGQDIVKGIVKGMINYNPASLMSRWANKFAQGIKDSLQIKSPSKLMIKLKIGNYTVEGILEGMQNELPSVEGEAKNIAYALNDGMKKAASDLLSSQRAVSVNDGLIGNAQVGEQLISQLGKKGLANSPQSTQINSGLQSATFVIQVGSREVAKEVITDLQGMAKSNGKPITITGS